MSMMSFYYQIILFFLCFSWSYAVNNGGQFYFSGPNKPKLFDAPESSDQDSARQDLYEAYNSLHSLAQDFKKPFDSPAVIVVGHQTSGKSALIEALMGFQFNQVITFKIIDLLE